MAKNAYLILKNKKFTFKIEKKSNFFLCKK